MSKKLNNNEIGHLIAIADKRINEMLEENKKAYKDFICDEELRDTIIDTNNAVIDILKSAIDKLSLMGD